MPAAAHAMETTATRQRPARRTEAALRLGVQLALALVLTAWLAIALTLQSENDRATRTDAVPPGRSVPYTVVPLTDVTTTQPLEELVYVDRLATNVEAFIRAAGSEHPAVQEDDGLQPRMTLVETLPVGDFVLHSVLPQTHDVLVNLTQSAETSLDISAMYWNLLGAADRKIHSDSDMKRFGADRGTQLYQALRDAAARGVMIRVLTAATQLNQAVNDTGEVDGGSSLEPELPDELQKLMDAYPQTVQVHTWNATHWYGGGILHQKVWIADRQDVYIGSANMDWKSLAQVMEMGVLLSDLHPRSPMATDLQRLFDVWWLWASPLFEKEETTSIYESTRYQATLRVPAWSRYLPKHHRAPDPFAEAGLNSLGRISAQLQVVFASPSTTALSPARIFVASAPLESTVDDSRSFDEDTLVYTIQTARKQVSLSVMDFTPYSMYTLDPPSQHAPIWWPALIDALIAGVYGQQGLHVRLLISEWQHSHAEMFTALQHLQAQAKLCQQMRTQCKGRLEVKIFRVPGWKNTTITASSDETRGGGAPLWPAFTRVNHAKYIVTDQRANIGTSNMEWGYFYTTAGISVNTDHAETRQALEDVFNRNWNSTYAQPLVQ